MAARPSEPSEPSEPSGPPGPPSEPAEIPASISAAPVIPTTHWTEPQQDDQHGDEEEVFDDGDSALGDDAASTTASLSASILEYRTFHGRTYHSLQGTAEHWAPNDDAHLESMDCVDFADVHPEAEVIGTDISPSQPEWVPPNLKFEIEDCTQPWTYARNSFDFVHLRYLFGSIPDWDALYLEAFRACKPGGWVEAVDPSVNLRSDDGSVREGTALYDWGRLFNEVSPLTLEFSLRLASSASTKYGRTMSMVDDGSTPDSFKKAGFVDIHSRTFKLPATPWAKDQKLQQLGAFSQLAMEQDLDGTDILSFSPLPPPHLPSFPTCDTALGGFF
ncbi:hypothetical protein EKO27_g1615 [Xylaria grammica]|uniref:Methyltransferase type 11 domain-containing protein n=1 Tax=Xylaria grammica TaxID=363999 RepID=A0A439DGL4_9PEZI|nr:hypothetical protein EKO27_g1615 [Xylaria grammica]